LRSIVNGTVMPGSSLSALQAVMISSYVVGTLRLCFSNRSDRYMMMIVFACMGTPRILPSKVAASHWAGAISSSWYLSLYLAIKSLSDKSHPFHPFLWMEELAWCTIAHGDAPPEANASDICSIALELSIWRILTFTFLTALQDSNHLT